MILGVDHIALSCSDIEAAVAHLAAWGFQATFLDKGLRNDPAKRPFLTEYRPTHHIAYCRASSGIAIELTQHAAPLTCRPSPYQVLFTGTHACVRSFSGELPAPWAKAFRTCFQTASPQPGCCPELSAQFWLDGAKGTEGLRVRAVLLAVPDLRVAERFWVEGFGAKKRDEAPVGAWPAWSLVSYICPIAAWSLDILLVSDGALGGGVPLLDASGFPSLALLTNSVEADIGKARDLGATQATSTFRMKVGGKPLRLALLRGPGGEPIELIEVERKKKGPSPHGQENR